MSIQYGDLPHIHADGHIETFGYCIPLQVSHTAHTAELQHPVSCHKCGNRVRFVASKSGSWFWWCFDCFR